MADDAREEVPCAEVPAHKDRHKDPADFVYLNKNLRACYVCRLVKSINQFREAGCDNCPFLDLDSEDRADQLTSTNFSGIISIMEPQNSWAAKWLHLARHVPGCYALTIKDEAPPEVQELMPERRH